MKPDDGIMTNACEMSNVEPENARQQNFEAIALCTIGIVFFYIFSHEKE